jgi:hypothetical protein
MAYFMAVSILPLLDFSLPEDVCERLWVEIVSRLASDCDASDFGRVHKLAVTALLTSEAPSVLVNYL